MKSAAPRNAESPERDPRALAGRMLLVVVLALSFTSACLIEHDHATVLYLEPDGTVTWTVQQQDIRSDAQDPAARIDEEREFLARVGRREHEAAEALAWLRPRSIETLLLRDERPYALRTSARLGALDRVYRDVLAGGGIPADVTLETGRGVERLTVTAWPGDHDDAAEAALPDMLWDLLVDCRIVLTEGRFVDATGFGISEDGLVATPLEIDEEAIERDGGRLRLSLEWTAPQR